MPQIALWEELPEVTETVEAGKWKDPQKTVVAGVRGDAIQSQMGHEDVGLPQLGYGYGGL